MTTASKRIPISERIGYSEILDPKFKTNALKICFFQPLSKETAAACALASDLVTSSSKAYPTNAVMSQKLHLLYGADLGSSVSKQGDLQLITLRASAIADRYALEQEPVFDTLLEILLGCILEPNAKDGAFQETEFSIKKEELLANIDAEINEKRQYAIQQTGKTAYQGEPAALSCYGTREDAEVLTPEFVYTAFQNLLQTAQIEIFFVGPEARPELVGRLREAFAALPTTPAKNIAYYTPSPAKTESVTVREALPVNQCKMVMAWKTANPDRYAVKLMALILGGTPSSKLFANVREKMSLCYYCAANYIETKQTMLVDCGIETENIEKAKTAIAAQLDALRSGEIAEEELESALMTIHNTMQGVGDTPSSYVSWYLGQLCRGTALTPTEEEQAYRKVTTAQIMEAAKSMQLDTIYIMECKA